MKEVHTEEYKRGFHCGYETARHKFENKLPRTKPDKSRLKDLCSIPPKIEWLCIEGDEEHHICSNCMTSFEWYEPFKFCPECGGRSPLADIWKGGKE